MIAALALTTTAPTLADMRDHRRVLVIAAASEAAPALVAQRRALAGWAGQAHRDVTVVEVVGARVRGAGDEASKLRQRLLLPPSRFAVVLVGKDGHVAFRSEEPVMPDQVNHRIDAMPMRRAGQR